MEECANAVATVVEGLNNLATVVTMDRDRTADLVQTNKTLVEQVAALTTEPSQQREPRRRRNHKCLAAMSITAGKLVGIEDDGVG